MARKPRGGTRTPEQPTGGDGNNAGGNQQQADAADGGSGRVIDPAAVAGAGSDSGGSDDGGTDSGGTRRRGRPRGSRNKEKISASDLEGFAAALIIIHAAFAEYSHIPELEIDKSDGEALARALATVADYYEINQI